MRLLMTLSILALAACAPPQPAYTPDFERNFMTSCEAQGSAATCGCTWERIEANIAPRDFMALERLPAIERDANPLMAQINGYLAECNASLAPPAGASEETGAPGEAGAPVEPGAPEEQVPTP